MTFTARRRRTAVAAYAAAAASGVIAVTMSIAATQVGEALPAPPTVTVSMSAPHPNTATATALFDSLTADGLSDAAAAGVLGNVEQESDFDPAARQDGGPGRGLAQWSVGGRWDTDMLNLLDFAEMRGLDPYSLDAQTQFMVEEMKSGIAGFNFDTFRVMDDPVAAAEYFHRVYERSADSDEFVRRVRGGAAFTWWVWFTSRLAAGESST